MEDIKSGKAYRILALAPAANQRLAKKSRHQTHSAPYIALHHRTFLYFPNKPTSNIGGQAHSPSVVFSHSLGISPHLGPVDCHLPTPVTLVLQRNRAVNTHQVNFILPLAQNSASSKNTRSEASPPDRIKQSKPPQIHPHGIVHTTHHPSLFKTSPHPHLLFIAQLPVKSPNLYLIAQPHHITHTTPAPPDWPAWNVAHDEVTTS